LLISRLSMAKPFGNLAVSFTTCGFCYDITSFVVNTVRVACYAACLNALTMYSRDLIRDGIVAYHRTFHRCRSMLPRDGVVIAALNFILRYIVNFTEKHATIRKCGKGTFPRGH